MKLSLEEQLGSIFPKNLTPFETSPLRDDFLCFSFSLENNQKGKRMDK
jgi:hypothetical protein